MIYPNNGRLAPAPVPVVKTAPVLLDNGQGTAIDPSCNDVITISCLQQLYNFVGYLPANNPNNSIGITGYLVSHISIYIRTYSDPRQSD